MMIHLYTIPNNCTHIAAHNVDSDTWDILPHVAGGYAQRAQWTNRTLQHYVLTAHNGIEHIYRDDIAEIAHHARWLGLPAGSTKSKYETMEIPA